MTSVRQSTNSPILQSTKQGFRRFALVNPKGGTGKTTSTLNLGAALSALGYSVLLVDLDPQASLTKTFFGASEYSQTTNGQSVREWPQHSAVHLLRDRIPLDQVIVPTGVANLSLIAGNIELRAYENELKTVSWTGLAHKRLGQLGDVADYVFFDTPGSTGLYAQMAMIASEVAIVTVQLENLAIYEIPTALATVDHTREYDNPALQVRFLLTMVDGRTKESKEAPTEMAAAYATEYIPVPIPRNVDAHRTISRRRPLVLDDPKNATSLAYTRAARYLVDTESLNAQEA